MAKKILIVEDEPPIREALKQKLSDQGYIIVTAADGVEGLASALQQYPDLILLDLIMPKMDGLTMLRTLRQDPWGKDARVIILTNDNEVSKVSEAMDALAYDYLIKSDKKLVDIVAKVKQRLGE